MILALFLLVTNLDVAIPEFGAGTCRAKSIQHLIGRSATPTRLTYIRRTSTAKIVRKHRDDQAITEDYRTDRVNIVVDKRNVILRISCG